MVVSTTRNVILCHGRTPSAKKCPVCGSYMVEKGNKIVCSETTCGYVEQKSKED